MKNEIMYEYLSRFSVFSYCKSYPIFDNRHAFFYNIDYIAG